VESKRAGLTAAVCLSLSRKRERERETRTGAAVWVDAMLMWEWVLECCWRATRGGTSSRI